MCVERVRKGGNVYFTVVGNELKRSVFGPTIGTKRERRLRKEGGVGR